MIELVRANDPVLISYLTSVLEEELISVVVLDEHTSVLEGSIGAIQRRVMVAEKDLRRAKNILEDIAPGELKE